MFKKILLVIVLVLAGLAVFAAVQKPEYTVYREVSIQAAPASIFPYINNTREGSRWMPWKEIDPKTEMSYSGPESGVGAKASWTSPGQMGVGSSTISQTVENQSVTFRLEYTKPFPMLQTSDITLTPNGGESVVRWSVSGKKPFFCRVIGIFMNMDKMVGGMFDQGLTKLKTLVEQTPVYQA